MQETVLYYTPLSTRQSRILKGILVRMGIRIRNVTPEQTNLTVGALVGLPGFESNDSSHDLTGSKSNDDSNDLAGSKANHDSNDLAGSKSNDDSNDLTGSKADDNSSDLTGSKADDSSHDLTGSKADDNSHDLAGSKSTDDSCSAELRTEASAIPEEVLVLHQFSEQRLDALLYALRKEKIRIALKAIVTEQNCSWTFTQLYEELKEEHVKMQQMQKR